MIDVDVLIVGGGAQGLWLLRDLTKHGYKAILLERHELGGGQTCHSHGLIHRGHYYDNVDMMIVLNAAAQFWQAFIAEKGIEKLNVGRALAGFGAGTEMAKLTNFWTTAGLQFEQCAAPPQVFRGGTVKKVFFETGEFSLDPSEVIENLADGYHHSIYKLEDADDALDFKLQGATVRGVTARLDGATVDIAPRFVMLNAGVGNAKLLKQLGKGSNAGAPDIPVQAQRQSHMMVLRGAELPMTTAVFPINGGLRGVFLCPRRDKKSGTPVWLVSDHRSVAFSFNDDGTTSLPSKPDKNWSEGMLTSLRAVAPAVLDAADTTGELEVAVYTGLTSERNYGSGQHMTDCFIDPLGLENVLTIWPTKLTPFASNIALRFIRSKIPDPSGTWPMVQRPIEARGVKVAPEMWTRAAFVGPTEAKTDWRPYSEVLQNGIP
jgi:glycine/D-amino acid oxidase-like deaminating enzyme